MISSGSKARLEKSGKGVQYPSRGVGLSCLKSRSIDGADIGMIDFLHYGEGDFCMGKKVTLEELWEMMASAVNSIRELAEEGKKTEAAQQKTEAALQEFKESVDKQCRELSRSVRNINTRWGQFMENLAEKDLPVLLRERGIQVDKILPHLLALKNDGYTRKAEYDLVAHNGEEIVVVEVKTTLFRKDIDRFLVKLGQFRNYFSDWKDYKIYGAMIYMGEAREEIGKAVPHAMEKGLLLIRCPEGEAGMAKIVNPEGFTPQIF